MPLSGLHVPDLRAEVIAGGIVAEISGTTIWRWLAADGMRSWAYRAFDDGGRCPAMPHADRPPQAPWSAPAASALSNTWCDVTLSHRPTRTVVELGRFLGVAPFGCRGESLKQRSRAYSLRLRRLLAVTMLTAWMLNVSASGSEATTAASPRANIMGSCAKKAEQCLTVSTPSQRSAPDFARALVCSWMEWSALTCLPPPACPCGDITKGSSHCNTDAARQVSY
jgi:hypothetical protein